MRPPETIAIVTASATISSMLTRSAGSGLSKSSRLPSTNDVTPPAVSRPKLGVLISSRSNTPESRMSATPAQFTGRMEVA